MITFAFGSVPKDGGTFTFYRNLRPALLEHDIDMRCVAVGKAQAALWQDKYADDGCVLIAPDTYNIKTQAMAFTRWCEDQQVDIVMGVNSAAILSALPHLPQRVRVLSRCANGFDHGYKITLSGKERLARIIALTPRLARDLVQHYDADPSLIHLIPNGIDPKAFQRAAATVRGRQKALQLGFLGRLEHNQKGVFHIPPIVRELNARNIPFELRIAGQGKHRRRLEKELSAEIAGGQVHFLGAIPPDAVSRFLAQTDVFLFTSHFEGCPNALLEAMMAGSVPLSWLIERTTDFIIDHGETGFICPPGDYKRLAHHLEFLVGDRKTLQTMSRQAARVARERFSNGRAAAAYGELLYQVMAEPPPEWTPRSWDKFTVDINFNRRWTSRLRAVPFLEMVKERIFSPLERHRLRSRTIQCES